MGGRGRKPIFFTWPNFKDVVRPTSCEIGYNNCKEPYVNSKKNISDKALIFHNNFFKIIVFDKKKTHYRRIKKFINLAIFQLFSIVGNFEVR